MVFINELRWREVPVKPVGSIKVSKIKIVISFEITSMFNPLLLGPYIDMYFRTMSAVKNQVKWLLYCIEALLLG